MTIAVATAAEPDAKLRTEAKQALRHAVEFFRTKVAVEGTYVWMYSEDLKLREGEGVVGATCGWIQPPGTPAVGIALLRAFEVTGETYYLDAAKETAAGLLRGQLKSGGWNYYVELDPQKRDTLDYRFDGGGAKAKKVTTFDDNTTQAALRFLMNVDRALKFNDAKIHEAVEYALSCVLKAQYPNGAWPQGYEGFPDANKFPVKPASYPDVWSHKWPKLPYKIYYTLNDQALMDVMTMMFRAARVYGVAEAGAQSNALAERCRAAAVKAGEFLLAAQMPEPQPAWAQQYDFEMHPAWARKFEPPAVTGGESQDVLWILMEVYRETGDRKFLEPIPRALAWLKRSRLPDGRLARFYELKTNEPLYFTQNYKLTQSDADLPTHYGFKVEDGTKKITAEFEHLKGLDETGLKKLRESTPRKYSGKLAKNAKAAIATQDALGRWVEAGGLRYHETPSDTQRVIKCVTFIKNVEALCRYLETTREP